MYPTFATEWPTVRDYWKDQLPPIEKALFDEGVVTGRLLYHGFACKQKLVAAFTPDMGPDRRLWFPVEHVLALNTQPYLDPIRVLRDFLAGKDLSSFTGQQQNDVTAIAEKGTFIDTHGRETKLAPFLEGHAGYKQSYDQWVAQQYPQTPWKGLPALVSACGEVRSIRAQWVCISLNPLDFMMASDWGKRESCFALKGGSKGDNLGKYLRTPEAGVVFVTKTREYPFDKTGRAWFFRHEHSAVLGRLYGTIQYLIGGLYKLLAKPEWPAQFRAKYPAAVEGYIDIDSIGFMAKRLEAAWPKLATHPKRFCLHCGDDHENPNSTALCLVCKNLKYICVGECRQMFDRDPACPERRRCAPCSEVERVREAERERVRQVAMQRAREEREAAERAERERLERINADRRLRGQPEFNVNEELIRQNQVRHMQQQGYYMSSGTSTTSGMLNNRGTVHLTNATTYSGTNVWAWTATYANTITLTGGTGYVIYDTHGLDNPQVRAEHLIGEPVHQLQI